MWLLWVSIDYTRVSQLSGATRAEHSHVLWCFLKGVISGLIPASAMPSTQPVHFSLLCISPCAALHQAQVSQSSCLVQSDLHGSTSERAPDSQSFSCSGFLGGTDWLTPKMVWRYLSSHAFTLAFIHVIILAVPTSVKALCWLPLLTSKTWWVPWRWALTTDKRLEIG